MDKEDIISSLRTLIEEKEIEEESKRNQELTERVHILQEEKQQLRIELQRLYHAIHPREQYFKLDRAIVHIIINPSIERGISMQCFEKRKRVDIACQGIREQEANLLSESSFVE